ncbi:hypothetical protein [Nocardioides sp.]|uniref:hypothetical protein n=1 Tax=Nocardioides sp. TaxID=35761 RepID=UPI002ED88086
MNASPVRGARFRGARARRCTVAALSALLATLLVAALATVLTPAPAGVAAAARRGSLTVTPTVQVPGQAVRFQGNIGRTGRRPVHLQSHMGRVGDRWLDVPGSSSSTNGRGDFDFEFPAPSMLRISYRVAAAGGLATSSYLFTARPQELTLTLAGEDPDVPFYSVAPLAPFTVVVDTTPAVRSALGSPPPIPGRTVLLQERADGNRWRTIDQGVTDTEGHASFRVAAPLLGSRVLRARQERWTEGRNEIGWYASFPAYFTVLGARAQPPAPASRAAAVVAAAGPSSQDVRPTAARRFGWGLPLYDFAWEAGQDLTTRPARGTRPRGTWLDTSDGTGRATPFNGGLVLQSKLRHGGVGDLGTTTATLRGNAQARGRWEFRLQGHSWEGGPRPYRFLLELVPPGAPVLTCSPRSIVVADATIGSPGLRLGVRSIDADAVWRRTLGGVTLAETPLNMAVEVTQGHVTWFVDSRPVATLKSPRARLGTVLVPRLSLVGEQQEMNGAQVDSDWQRSWDLGHGQQVASGPAPTRSAYSSSC